MHRYAIYFAPERAHPLWRAGCSVLGRDPETGETVAQAVLDGVAPARLAAITDDARRYGWHGTLKPPFALADGADPDALDAALDRFAAGHIAFAMPELTLASLSGFLAVVPAARSPALDALADAAVREFDRFRRPPEDAEVAKRRRNGLDATEEANLARWGYPYVMDRFRFHMTLTARLDDTEREAVAASLRPLLADSIAAPLVADAVALYGEPAPGEPFVLLRRYPFMA